ncbi:hypothetical protein D7X25_24860 [bacterium 1XD42-8]|nr:hypothetical protein D7X25_24860 [bacterium 1XD42-8]
MVERRNCLWFAQRHIEYTFHAFCRVVKHYAAINAWRDRDEGRQRVKNQCPRKCSKQLNKGIVRCSARAGHFSLCGNMKGFVLL